MFQKYEAIVCYFQRVLNEEKLKRFFLQAETDPYGVCSLCHCIQSVPAMMLLTKKSEVKLSESRTDTITRTHVIGAKC